MASSMIPQILAAIDQSGPFGEKFGKFDVSGITETSTHILNSFLDTHPKIHKAFQDDVCEYVQTKYHKENLYDHSICTGVFSGCFASVFYDTVADPMLRLSREDFVRICIEAGTLHDIGKPLARVTLSGSKIKHLYTGHAQLGTRLIDSIMRTHPFKNAIEWAVNHHMCYCTHCHMHDFTSKHPCYESMMMDLNTSDPSMAHAAMALLSVLAFADMFARIDSNFDYDVQRTSQYSFDLYAKLKEVFGAFKPVHTPKTVIHMIGLSGSGKSHTTKFLHDTFGDKYDIIVVERDRSLYASYAEILQKPFDEVTKISYQKVYQAMIEHKGTTQSRWVTDLVDALTQPILQKQQLIIIDTCQTLYPVAWKNTVEAFDEEATAEYANATKIGFYTIPANMLGITHQTKTPEYTSLPNTATGAFWPNLVSEIEKSDSSRLLLTYATGSITLLSTWLDANFGKITTIINPDIQQDLLHNLLNAFAQSNTHLATCEEICTEFTKSLCSIAGGCFKDHSEPFVVFRVEQQSDLFKLITFTYRDGFQQFNMKTRDYRGEGIIYDCVNKVFSLIRPALPVFPEMTTVVADHRVLPYIVDNFHHLFHSSSPNHAISNMIERKEITQIVVTPKYDGSLFNLTFIGSSHPMCPMIMDIISKTSLPPQSYFQTENGVYLIGSKGACFAKDPVNARIHRSILGSYPNMTVFLSKMDQVVSSFDTSSNIVTMHFEAIDVTPTEELTVYYGYSAAIFFGITSYNNITNEKRFMLPSFVDSIDKTIRLASMIPCKKFSDVVEMFNNSYKELLRGNENTEPEGFVVHIFDDVRQCWFPIKYKFDLYYVAHKPNSIKNQGMAKRIVEEPEFASVIKRFMKFREKPTMAALLNQNNYTTQVNQFVQSNFSALCTRLGQAPSKRDWALFWKENMAQLDPLQQVLDSNAQLVSTYYPGYVEKVSSRALNLLMNLYIHLAKTQIVQSDIDKIINDIFA